MLLDFWQIMFVHGCLFVIAPSVGLINLLLLVLTCFSGPVGGVGGGVIMLRRLHVVGWPCRGAGHLFYLTTH